MKLFLPILLTCLLWMTSLSADVLYLKDGKTVKGIVVEAYNDRVVLSTHDGEKPFLTMDIAKIVYDVEGQNLIALGDAYASRREYEKAFFYYEKAHKLNPEDKNARDKMNYVMGYLFRTAEQRKKDAITRRQEFEEWPRQETEEKTMEARLKERFGMRLADQENRIVITEVLDNSAAAMGGLKKGDRLVSVWGKLTGYMSVEEASHLLLEKSFGEIKIGIERNMLLEKKTRSKNNYQKIIGGKMDMQRDGLTVTELTKDAPGWVSGLRPEDLITAINGDSTRYLPLREAASIIENRKNDNLVFTVRRNITVWRK